MPESCGPLERRWKSQVGRAGRTRKLEFVFVCTLGGGFHTFWLL